MCIYIEYSSQPHSFRLAGTFWLGLKFKLPGTSEEFSVEGKVVPSKIWPRVSPCINNGLLGLVLSHRRVLEEKGQRLDESVDGIGRVIQH